MSLPEDSGVVQLSRLLDALDGRVIRTTTAVPPAIPADERTLRELEERLARVRRHNANRRGR